MKVQVAVLSLAALAFAGSALSQQKESGIYIGGALGQAEQSDQCSSTAPGVSCDNKDSAWKIFGGFQFSRYFAAELGYANLGEASASARWRSCATAGSARMARWGWCWSCC